MYGPVELERIVVQDYVKLMNNVKLTVLKKVMVLETSQRKKLERSDSRQFLMKQNLETISIVSAWSN